MASIKDVATQAGVSIATVSRVLSNRPNVRPEVRQQVLRVVEELGYRPNRIASSLRKQQSHTIGVLVSDIRNPFFTAITRAIEDLANTQEMSVFLCNTDEDPDKELLYLNTLLDENVAGIIWSPTQENATAYDFLWSSGTPVVTIDRRIIGASVDCVLSDNVQSAYMLTIHLLENGYRRISAVFGLQNSTTGRERLQGYKLALSEYDIRFDQSLVAYVYPRETEAEEFLNRLLGSKHNPDAILTGNSRLTIGALNALKTAHMRFPDDIALCGFDETPWTPHVGNGITVISQPTYEMGQTAADLLFQRINNATRPTREVILKGKLLKRDSTRQLS
jgi:LacI family transcriptional regulator, fructose operon transcriptional repressor